MSRYTDALIDHYPDAWVDLAGSEHCMPGNVVDSTYLGVSVQQAYSLMKQSQDRSVTEQLRACAAYEQLTYLWAVNDFQGAADDSERQLIRVDFAWRVSLARARRRELAQSLLADFLVTSTFAGELGQSVDAQTALDEKVKAFEMLVLYMAARPFDVPPLLMNEDAPAQRLDADALKSVCTTLRQAMGRTDVLANLAEIFQRARSQTLTTSVKEALARLLPISHRLRCIDQDTVPWLTTTAEVADDHAIIRCAPAMFKPKDGFGEGQPVDLVVALQPAECSDRVGEEELRTLLDPALKAVCGVLGDDSRHHSVRAWFHDFRGGTSDVLSARQMAKESFSLDSAGVAVAIALASALTGRHIRPNRISTGVVGEDGSVKTVGASIETKVRGLFRTKARQLFELGYVPRADYQKATGTVGTAPLVPLANVTQILGATPDAQQMASVPAELVLHPLLPSDFKVYLEAVHSASPTDYTKIPDGLGVGGQRAEQAVGEALADLKLPLKGTAAVRFPWWMSPDGGPHSNFDGELVFVKAGWIGDRLLRMLAERAQKGTHVEKVPVFLRPPAAGERAAGDWLLTTLQTTLANHVDLGASPEIRRWTTRTYLREGRFRFLIDADRLDDDAMRDDAMRDVLRQVEDYSDCSWVFLCHATRCNGATYLRHQARLAGVQDQIDLLPDEVKNSSIWDRYLQLAAQALVTRMRLPEILGIPERSVDVVVADGLANFFLGTDTGTIRGSYLPRQLGQPQDSSMREQRPDGGRRPLAPASLDAEEGGLFQARTVGDADAALDILSAPSGRGKTMELLYRVFTWLADSKAASFGAVPLLIDANAWQYSRARMETFAKTSTNWLREAGPALGEAMRGLTHPLSTTDLLRNAFAAAVSALGCEEKEYSFLHPSASYEQQGASDGLGAPPPAVPCSAEFWTTVLYRLGPTTVLLDGIRELPESSLDAHSLVRNLFNLADGVRSEASAAPVQPAGYPTRIVVVWRDDLSRTAFASDFWAKLEDYKDARYRRSELRPADEGDVLRYIGQALHGKPPVLARLQELWTADQTLRASFTSNLRLLPVVGRLEEQNLLKPTLADGSSIASAGDADKFVTTPARPYNPKRPQSLLKVVLEPRWRDGGQREDIPDFRLYGGQIVRWAMVDDCWRRIEQEKKRLADGEYRAMDLTSSTNSLLEAVGVALGLLAYLATVTEQGRGHILLQEEAARILTRVFELEKPYNGYVFYRYQAANDAAITVPDRDPVRVVHQCAKELDLITGRIWVKGTWQEAEQSELDFRHEEDRRLAVVWLLDYILANWQNQDKMARVCVTIPHDCYYRDPSLPKDTASGTLEGLELVKYAFALENVLEPRPTNDQRMQRRTQWEPIHLLYEEASNEARHLFELPEIQRHFAVDGAVS